MAHEWDSFLSAADEWIINYSLPPSLHIVKLFSIGHALELYLKASCTKITNDIDKAIGFSHDIPKIWGNCKLRDPAFLGDYELRKSVLKRNLLDVNDYQQLERDDFKHFLHYQELYVVSKYLADLKYLGAPLKKIKGAYVIAFVFPNPEWIKLFRALRSYLGHPQPGKPDMIRLTIEQGHLPASSIRFLSDLLD